MVGEVRNREDRVSLWAALIATALIVMGSSARVVDGNCNDDDFDNDFDNNKLCKRTRLGIAVGSISVILAVMVVLVKMYLGTGILVAEFGTSVVLAVMNAVGVAYITSNEGPGKAIGNAYYSSWASFLLAGYLVAECFGEFRGLNRSGQGSESSAEGNGAKVDDFPVESLDENPGP